MNVPTPTLPITDPMEALRYNVAKQDLELSRADTYQDTPRVHSTTPSAWRARARFRPFGVR